jgi:hypothetical protein
LNIERESPYLKILVEEEEEKPEIFQFPIPEIDKETKMKKH